MNAMSPRLQDVDVHQPIAGIAQFDELRRDGGEIRLPHQHALTLGIVFLTTSVSRFSSSPRRT